MQSRQSAWQNVLPSIKQVLATSVAAMMLAGTPVRAETDGDGNDRKTTSPIKHVIIIIGENRSFDHVYATYKPRRGQFVSNLLSKGIIKADGTPGPNYALSAQYSAVSDNGTFELSPGEKTVYEQIPTPLTDGTPKAASDTSPAPFQTLAVATKAEPDLFHSYNLDLLTGASGLDHGVPDTRIDNLSGLKEGVFQLTPGVKYDDYAASPVHRFYQMWQQLDSE
jgi:phospholipase C